MFTLLKNSTAGLTFMAIVLGGATAMAADPAGQGMGAGQAGQFAQESMQPSGEPAVSQRLQRQWNGQGVGGQGSQLRNQNRLRKMEQQRLRTPQGPAGKMGTDVMGSGRRLGASGAGNKGGGGRR